MASSWILFFSYQDDARSITHHIPSSLATGRLTEESCFSFLRWHVIFLFSQASRPARGLPFNWCLGLGREAHRLISIWPQSLYSLMECTLPILYSSFQLLRSFRCAVTKEVYDCPPVLCLPSPFKGSLFFLQEIISALKGPLEFAAMTI